MTNLRKLTILTVLILNISCSHNEDNSFSIEYTIPIVTNDGWEVTAPSNQSLDEEKLAYVDFIIKNNEEYSDIETVTIVRNGKLVFDEFYYTGDYNYNKGDITSLQSVTKSFASIFVGIAIDQGLINSVTDPVKTLLPNLSDLDWSNGKDNISLEHILNMTAGLSGEDGGVPYEDRDPLKVYDSLRAYDYGRHMFSKEMEGVPGEIFEYRTALTNTLRDILANSIGNYNSNVIQYIEDNFFNPLNINEYNFVYNNDQGHIHLGGGLLLAPRDIIKLGQIILDEGVWKENTIISPNWINQATDSQISFNPRLWDFADGYSYSFWHRIFIYQNSTIPSIIAAGSFGQYLVIFPTLDTVILITSWYDEGVPKAPISLIEDHILSAIN